MAASFRSTQRGTCKDGAVLRDVDFVSAEHRIHPPPQTGLVRKPKKEFEGPVRDAILRIIQEQSCCLNRQALATLRISGEQFPEMRLAEFFMVKGKGFPSRSLGEWSYSCFHI
jgi:hypothetical protein